MIAEKLPSQYLYQCASPGVRHLFHSDLQQSQNLLINKLFKVAFLVCGKMIIFKLKRQYCVFSLSDCKNHSLRLQFVRFRDTKYLPLLCLHSCSPDAGMWCLDFIKQSLGMLLLFPILDYPETVVSSDQWHKHFAPHEVLQMYMKGLPFEDKVDLFSPLCSKYQ